MAVAVASRGMGPNDEQNVHPFFKGRKKLAIATPTSIPTPTSLLTSAAGGGAAVTALTGHDRSGQVTVQNALSSGDVKRLIGNGLAVTEVGGNAIETGVSSAAGRDDLNFDSDPNYGRSKRRRTASPETHSLLDTSPFKRTGQNQVEATEHYMSPYKQEEEGNPTVVQGSERATAAVTSGHADIVPETTRLLSDLVEINYLAPPVEKAADSMNHDTTELPTGSVGEQSEKNDPPEPKTPRKKRTPTKGPSKKSTLTKESPQKKILKLSSDGKLGSPRSRAAATTGSRTRGKGGSASSKRNSGARVVAIKYGSTEESRASMAQRIQDILVSTTPNQSVDMTRQAKATKPPLPQKSTHPFFLGKPGRKTGPDQISPDIVGVVAGAESQPPLSENSSPKNAKYASGARARAEAWSALAGVGGKFPDQQDPKAIKIPGAKTPLWPPKGMVHIRDLPSISLSMETALQNHRTVHIDRKMKGATVQVPEQEDVLLSLTRELYRPQNDTNSIPHLGYQVPRSLRLPLRRVITGLDLQQAVQLRLICTSPARSVAAPTVTDEEKIPHVDRPPTHGALLRLYGRLPLSQSAFDKAECETQAWVQKYAPKCANDVLQQGREAILLRDWMKSLTVTSVDSGSKDPSSPKESSNVFRRHNIKSKKKKRRIPEELDGFIISSDEEAMQMDELTDPGAMPSSLDHRSASKKTVIRAADTLGMSRSPSDARTTNTVVISGPHGCGKTATVYALAHELDFEVFEINAGSRRSGRDLLDRVGDMTRNHLVHHSNGTVTEDANEDLLQLTESLKQDLESGRQANMKSFFKPKLESGKRLKTKAVTKSNQAKVEKPPKKQKNQKQSLILLEEVDVLFEEDKQFWMTTLGLILQSKRPIIMTCTDESLLPLDEMALYGIFRFVPAPEALVTDYMLLLAANEGHLLSPDAMLALYRCKRRDLRASITELQFFCQMGIGDTKGGLEWMLIGTSADEASKKTQGVLRVVSDGTYLEGMGWLGGDNADLQADPTTTEEAELTLKAWNEWGIKSEDGRTSEASSVYLSSGSYGSEGTSLETHLLSRSRENLKALENLDQSFEALSASDVFPALGFRCDNTAILDATLPAMAEKARGDFIEGFPLLHADPLVDHTGLSASIAVQLKVCARRSLLKGDSEAWLPALTSDSIARMIIERGQPPHIHRLLTRAALAAAFGPIAEPSKTSLSSPRGAHSSSFDSPTSVLVEDIAPYIRSIVSFDVRLEEQRLRLSNLLSQGGRNGKRMRTTRASRAALEGGSKAYTRRERWFPSKTNFPMVLRTGGYGWQDALLQESVREGSGSDNRHDDSRRSSLASTTGSESVIA